MRQTNIYGWRSRFIRKNIVKPQEFLKWAKKDIEGGEKRSIANALTNAKRAIHSRMDEILECLRIQYSRDWDKLPNTELKIKALRALGMDTSDIVKVLTTRRNNLEHRYILPSIGEARSDVQITALWLKDSERYLKPSILVGGLRVRTYGVSFHGKSKTVTVSVEFDRQSRVDFFWDRNRELIRLVPGKPRTVIEYNALKWKELVRIQKRYYPPNGLSPVPISAATAIFRAYERWVAGKRGPKFERTYSIRR